MKIYHYFWRLIRYSYKYFITDISSATFFWLSATVLGLILRAYFNYLTGDGDSGLPVGTVVGLQIGYATLTAVMLAVAILANTALRYRSMALMIRNMLARILEMPGARPLPDGEDGQAMSSGQVISTFRDDTNEMVEAITVLEDLLGTGITAFISLAIMIQINPLVTLGTFVPLAIIILIAERLGKVVKKYRKASREATSQVTGIIADMFNGAQAIKVSNAEKRIVAHFGRLNDQRREAMVKDRLLTQLVDALSWGMTDIGVGLILLLTARAMYAGEFTIGDFALFTAYIWPITDLVRHMGGGLTRYKQAGVSVQRMETLMQGAEAGGPVAHQPVYMDGHYPPLPYTPKTAAHHLHTLSVTNLGYHYPGSANGVSHINLNLQRGSFTVITGRIASGKTTLLKALLGLLPAQSGEIRWNGETVTDPANFFSLPRCAYTGQTPRLFSQSLRDNILLGLPETEVDLSRAVKTVVMEKDLLDMDDGLETLVGPRGVRLSGGQIQRTAAARMFVRQPELLIFDDLSSALDVETERTLWTRIFAAHKDASPTFDQNRPTCLVVSHRRTALRRANHIIVLKDGQVEDEGPLDKLLARNEEMQRLWQGDGNN